MKLTRWAFALALGAALGIMAGCNPPAESKTGSGEAPAPAAAGGKKFKVGVSIPSATHGWTAGVKWWAEQAAKAHPDIEWIIEDANEPSAQNADLENLKAQGVDAVVILATESASVTPTAKQLREAGILIINVDRGFTEPVADVFIEGDNKAFGREAAEFIVKKLNGTGNVAVLEGLPSTVNTDRTEAALAVFRANPGIKVVAQGSGRWNREEAEKTAATMLTQNPKIDAIWAADDDMALGVENALRAANRTEGVWMVGGGGMKDVVKRIMDGDKLYPATITYSPSMIAVGMQTAAGMLRAGKDASKQYMPRHMKIDVELVTQENAKDYYFPESIY